MKAYETTGIIEFASNADANINQYATQQFQQQLQSAQPGTRLIELGARESVLAAVGAKQLDADAIKKIGQKYGVTAIVHGGASDSHAPGSLAAQARRARATRHSRGLAGATPRATAATSAS